MTFTPEQQSDHRKAFINECRQKTWGAACHAEWISKQLDKFVEDYGKLKAEDEKLLAEINTLTTAIDEHTKDNRDKRKALQERRNALAKQMEFLGQTIQAGQRTANTFYSSIESTLALAKHAETWEWKETGSNKEKD